MQSTRPFLQRQKARVSLLRRGRGRREREEESGDALEALALVVARLGRVVGRLVVVRERVEVLLVQHDVAVELVVLDPRLDPHVVQLDVVVELDRLVVGLVGGGRGGRARVDFVGLGRDGARAGLDLLGRRDDLLVRGRVVDGVERGGRVVGGLDCGGRSGGGGRGGRGGRVGLVVLARLGVLRLGALVARGRPVDGLDPWRALLLPLGLLVLVVELGDDPRELGRAAVGEVDPVHLVDRALAAERGEGGVDVGPARRSSKRSEREGVSVGGLCTRTKRRTGE